VLVHRLPLEPGPAHHRLWGRVLVHRLPFFLTPHPFLDQLSAFLYLFFLVQEHHLPLHTLPLFE
jgi:hypothetical protein